MSGERITGERDLATGLPWRNGGKLRTPSVLTTESVSFNHFINQ